MLLPNLAEKIVKEVQKLIDEEIIVVTIDGNIIASSDQSRINTFHEGALIAAQQRKKLIISENDQEILAGVKEGINLPIFFQQDVIGVIGITGEPLKVTPFGEIVRKMTELLISENYYSEQFDWQSRALEAFIIDWIQIKEWDSTFLNRSKLFSVNLQCNRIAAIIEFPGLTRPLTRDVWTRAFNWFQGNKNDITVRWGNERMVILLDSAHYSKKKTLTNTFTAFISFLQSAMGIFAVAGVGQETIASEVGNSFRQAERALRIAHSDKKNIVFDENLTLEMLYDEVSYKTKVEFINRTIGKILKENELLLTLKELFRQNHSLKNTAEHLHIHINTLHYRLKKLEEITSLTTTRTRDLLTIYLALQFLDENPKID